MEHSVMVGAIDRTTACCFFVLVLVSLPSLLGHRAWKVIKVHGAPRENNRQKPNVRLLPHFWKISGQSVFSFFVLGIVDLALSDGKGGASWASPSGYCG